MTEVPDQALGFFVDEVEPTVNEFLAEWQSVRRARLAAIMLAHMADHFFWKRPGERQGVRSEDEFRQMLADGDADFSLICDVANASKHAELRVPKPPKAPREVTSSSQVATGALGWGESRFGEGRWGSPLQIVVTSNSGDKRVLEAPVRNVLGMWRRRLGLPDVTT